MRREANMGNRQPLIELFIASAGSGDIMNEKPRMAVRRSKRTRRLAPKQSFATLYNDDYKQVLDEIKTYKKTEAEVIRELVSEALRSRRLRQAGRDETLSAVRTAQHEVVSGEVKGLKDVLAQVLDLLRRGATTQDQILLETRVIGGQNHYALKTIFDAKEILEEHVLTPALAAQGQGEEQIDDAIKEADAEWERETHELSDEIRTDCVRASETIM